MNGKGLIVCYSTKFPVKTEFYNDQRTYNLRGTSRALQSYYLPWYVFLCADHCDNLSMTLSSLKQLCQIQMETIP